MRASNHPGRILPQDTGPGDAEEEVLAGLAISVGEVQELLYGDDRPVEARIDRLQELAEELRAREAGEVADNDAASLLGEIEWAIGELRSKRGHANEGGALDVDPLAHRETLAPDSDEREALEDADEESVEDDIGEVLAPDEWDEGDGFDPDRGVR
ncbi:MAG TPA: hypothetical protein VGN80_13045 [Devosiaceae bacterium]|nr:hypothetical protein [Devosiaceae bacterium]